MKKWGQILIGAGVLGVVYFFCFFDTSVATGIAGIENVNNLGLMNTRQNGIIICLAMIIIGVLLILFGKDKQTLTTSPSMAELAEKSWEKPVESTKMDPYTLWLRECTKADLEHRPRPPKPE